MQPTGAGRRAPSLRDHMPDSVGKKVVPPIACQAEIRQFARQCAKSLIRVAAGKETLKTQCGMPSDHFRYLSDSSLRNQISGLAVPQLVVDLPGGHGKIPLVPRYIERLEEDRLLLTDFRNRTCTYPLLPGEAGELGAWLG